MIVCSFITAGEKPFKCEKCDYSSADTKSLRYHSLQKHSSEDKTLYKCSECDYSTPVLRYHKVCLFGLRAILCLHLELTTPNNMHCN